MQSKFGSPSRLTSTLSCDTLHRTNCNTRVFYCFYIAVPSIITNRIPLETADALKAAKHVVVFTGAGVSAESGIPTFRDASTGLWANFEAQDLATADAFRKDKALVWGWYEWRRHRVMRSRPNSAHEAVAALAHLLPKLTVVTQNVDDLHERAGSMDVPHLHGSLHCPRCFACGRPHILPYDTPQEPEVAYRLTPPVCSHCGGSVRPGVVWFGESLPERVLVRAFAATRACDLLLAVGTSGLVHPASRLPRLAKEAGATVVQINPTGTPLDLDCTWSLRGNAGVLMPRLVKLAFPSVT